MKKLTMAQLLAVKPGAVFAKGVTRNSPIGVYMTDAFYNRKMMWIAKRGQANDWAIYIGWEENNVGWIAANGDKVNSIDHIQKLVPCDEEALAAYRH